MNLLANITSWEMRAIQGSLPSSYNTAAGEIE